MMLRLLVIGVALGVTGGSWATDKVPFPRHVPPLVGTAVVIDAGGDRDDDVWEVRVTVPETRWIYDGTIIAKIKGPSISAEVKQEELRLTLGGPFQLSPSEFFDVSGMPLKKAEVLNRLKRETAVLVSVSQSRPDPYYLQLIKPDTIIIVVGPRDGAPLPSLLPAEKQPSETKK